MCQTWIFISKMITNYVKFWERTLEFPEASLILKKMKILSGNCRKKKCIWGVYWIVLWIIGRFYMKNCRMLKLSFSFNSLSFGLKIKFPFFDRPRKFIYSNEFLKFLQPRKCKYFVFFSIRENFWRWSRFTPSKEMLRWIVMELFPYGKIKDRPTIPHKNIETSSRFTTKIDISSHMESLNFQSGNDETA